MAKLTLPDVGNILGNPTSAQSRINSNNTLIEQALENTLSRNGATPNQMGADIDMNQNDILNVNIIQSDDFIVGGGTVTGALQLAQDSAISAAEDADRAEAAANAVRDYLVLAEFFPGANDTEKWQNAIDYLSELGGGTVKGSKHSYTFTNLVVSSDNITLDFNYSTITADPTTSGANGSPVIYAHGSAGIARAISSTTVNSFSVVATGYGSDFSAGDMVLIHDDTVVPAWNYGLTPSPGSGYQGRTEINLVSGVSGDTVNLAFPIGRAYSTSPVIQKIVPINNFRVCNIGLLNEVDPGAAFTGSVEDMANAPHIIGVKWAILPHIQDVVVDRFQLHAVCFKECLQPSAERIRAETAFRPSVGGHGYLLRFECCRRGLVTNSVGKKIRHVVDDVQSIDCTSENNTGFNTVVSSFKAHGLGSIRFTSLNDAHYGGYHGWDFGNPSFSADYDMTIINPRGEGGQPFVEACALADGLTIINPQFDKPNGRAILCTSGVKRLKILGGKISAAANTINGVLVRSRLASSDTYGVDCEDVEIDGVQWVQTENPSTYVVPFGVGCKGWAIIQNINGRADHNINTLVEVGNTTEGATPDNVRIRDNRLFGAGTGMLLDMLSVPPGRFDVIGNIGNNRNIRLTPTGRLVLENNDIGTGSWVFLTTTIKEAMASGAYVSRNIPQVGSQRVVDPTLVDSLYTKQGVVVGDAGSARNLIFGTRNGAAANNYDEFSTRAILRLTSDAESGSNAGSNLELVLRSDAGASLHSVLYATRQSGKVTMSSGEFEIAGTYDKPFRMGGYRLWVNSGDGKLYIKSTQPTTATDGTVVGTQT